MSLRNVLIGVRSVLFLVIALSATIVSAQRPDILLSSDEPHPVISAGLLIQSMATIGDIRLVVWGGSEDIAGQGTTGVLYMQMLRDTVPVGSPVPLVGWPSRPTRFVQVIALEDRFLVCWNDERPGASGLYGRVVEINGRVSSKLRYWPGPISSAGIGLHPTASGTVLLWSDTSAAGSIYAQLIGRDGLPQSDAHAIAEGKVLGVRPMTSRTGRTVIERGDQIPIILDAQGNAVPISDAAAAKLSSAYYLGDDGEVITMIGDTVKVYASIFDSEPRTIRLAYLEDARLKGSAVPSRDAQGRLQISYAVGEGSAVGSYWGEASSSLIGQVRSATEQTVVVFNDPKILTSYYLIHLLRFCLRTSLDFLSADIRRIGYNYYRVVLHYDGITIVDCQSHGGPDRSYYTRDFTYAVAPYQATADSLNSSVLSLDSSAATVFRMESTAGSVVDVAIGRRLIRLIAP